MRQLFRSGLPVGTGRGFLVLAATLLVLACAANDATAPVPTVTGTVIAAATGDPVSGAQVSIGVTTVTTGADGRFVLSNVAPGTTKLRCAAAGFKVFEADIDVPAHGITRDIALAPAELFPVTPTTPTGSGSLLISGVMTPRYQGVRVSRGGAPVTDAVVTVNGFPIPHCCGDLYSGNLPGAVPAGGTLNLKVVAGGVTFEAPGEVIATPTITAPAAGSTFAPTDTIGLAWSTPTDPDRFEVCLNCWENSLDGEIHPASGSAREFKIAPNALVDYGGGAVVAVYAFKNNFLKSAGSPDVTSNVLFVARSSDALITIKY